MTTLRDIRDGFFKHLGKVDVELCAIDAALSEIDNHARATGSPQAHLANVAKKRGHHLHFKTLPELSKPLGTYGIVFMHQVAEEFYDQLSEYLKDRGAYAQFDPNNSRPQPKGENDLRRIARELCLIDSRATKLPDYTEESPQAKASREEELYNLVGRLEVTLVDYYRLVRNGAVHADNGGAAREKFISIDQDQMRRAKTIYQIQPNPPGAIVMSDMILYSKILQHVVRVFCAKAPCPDIRVDVLPSLEKKFRRYGSKERRRNAIIGALRSEYQLDVHEAAAYADELLKW